MQTKYNVGDTVLIEAKINRLEADKNATTYHLRVLDRTQFKDAFIKLYEDDIVMLFVDTEKEETD